MATPSEDWAQVLERLLEGDQLALMQLTRLLNSFLGRWNAYDFRDEWDDLIQEVILAAATAMRDGKIRERAAVVGYLRSTARFKFVDRLKAHLRQHEDDHLAWEDVVEGPLDPGHEDASPAVQHDVRQALESLEEHQRIAVVQCKILNRTIPEAVAETGIPEGSLKRYLRQGLQELRERLEPLLEEK